MNQPLVDCGNAVQAFHEKYGHWQGPSGPEVPERVIRDLRLRLIVEEYEEFRKAFDEYDLVEMADGAADLVYVLVGFCLAFGIDFNRVFQEVHRSNMTKDQVVAPPGQKYGTKTPKGKDYIKPDIAGILFNPTEKTLLERLAEEGTKK